MDKSIKKGKRSSKDPPSPDLTPDMTNATTTAQPPLFDPPSLDLNLTPPSIDQQPPPSVTSTSSTEPEPEPELNQEAKRLKLTFDLSNPAQDSPFPISPDDDLSRFPIASRQPSHSPPSGRPPRPPAQLQTQLTIGSPMTATSGPIGLAQPQAKRDLNPAQILLHVPEERSRANFKLARQKAKKGRVDLVGPLMLSKIRPGLSPLGPGHPAPHDFVKQVLSNVKAFLDRFLIMKSFSNKSQPPNSTLTPATLNPPPFQPLSLHATTSSAPLSLSEQTQPIAPPALALSTSSALTVEQVLHMLDEYMETIPKTSSAQEMEDRLQEFQIRVKVDPVPSWYGLMKKSSLDFFDNLTEYFVCEALESDPEDDDQAGSAPSSSDQTP